MPRLGSSAVILAVVLAAVAVGAWLLQSENSVARDTFDEVGDERLAQDTLQVAPSLQGSTPSFSVAGGGDLSGTVVRKGEPVPAQVALWPLVKLRKHEKFTFRVVTRDWRRMDPLELTSPDAVTQADDQGRFSFDNVPRGQYYLVATFEGAQAADSIRVTGLPPRRAYTLRLPAQTFTLRGRVVDTDGRPWKGFVRAMPGDRWSGYRGRLPGHPPLAPTDENGAFEVPGLPPGSVTLYAHIPGAFDDRVDYLQVPAPGPVTLTVSTVDWVEGVVVAAEDERPIAGAVVFTRCSAMFRAVTDDEGRFRAPVHHEGSRAQMFVRAEGFTPTWFRPSRHTPRLRLMLARAGSLRGRVVSQKDGKPIADVEVIVVVPDQRSWGWTTRTNAEGRFELHQIAAGTLEVAARGQGWVHVGPPDKRHDAQQVVVPPGSSAVLTMPMRRAPGLRGRVLDEHGKGLGEVRIRARLDEGAWKSINASQTLSNPDGTFVLPELDPELVYRLRVLVEGHRPVYVSTVAGDESIDIRITPERWFEVQVANDLGPLAHARVWLDSRSPWTLDTTNEQGLAHVGPIDAVGPITVLVRAPGHEESRQKVTADRFPMTVVLKRTLEIRGRVTYWGGEPAPKIRVHAAEQYTHTDADGAFVLEDVPVGTHTIHADVDNGDPWNHTSTTTQADAGDTDVVLRAPTRAPPPKAADVEAPQPTRIEVRVEGPDGRPVPRASVFWRRKSSTASTPVLGGIAEVPADATEVHVHEPRDAAGRPLPYLRQDVGTFPAGVRTFTVRMQPARQLGGVVVDENDQPIWGVGVKARAGTTHTTTTDAEGRFRFVQLKDGKAEVRLVTPPRRLDTPPQISDPDSTELRFVLRMGVEAVITVVNPRGTPVPKATVRYAGDAGEGKETTDGQGVARLVGLDPRARYSLDVDVSDGELFDARLARWKPADTTVRLKAGLSVSGTVVDLSGQPVRHILVRCEGHESDATNAKGEFTIRGLPPGDVTLRATFGEDQVWNRGEDVEIASGRSESVEVPAGSSGVVLRIDPLASLTIRIRDWPSDPHHAIELMEYDPEETYPRRDPTFWSGWWGKRASPSPAGVATFRNAPRDKRFSIWLGPLADGRYLYEEQLAPGEHTLSLQRGGTVKGVVRAPSVRWKSLRVAIDHHLIGVTTTPDPDGHFVLRGVPQGTWTIRASCRIDRRAYEGSVTASPGATIEIDVQPVPENDD